jgi:hypothetical protein
MIIAMHTSSEAQTMIRKTYGVALVAMTALLTWQAPAFAQGGDPTKIGDNTEKIVSDNAEAFWNIGAIIVALFLIFGKPKGSLVASMLIGLVISGVIIHDPGGFGDMIQKFGNRIL